eukprot:1190968-Prorocentrum_minimum.AAC.1
MSAQAHRSRPSSTKCCQSHVMPTRGWLPPPTLCVRAPLSPPGSLVHAYLHVTSFRWQLAVPSCPPGWYLPRARSKAVH